MARAGAAHPFRRRSRWRRATLALAALLVAPAGARASAPSVAFFYGTPVPVAELRRFDWVVVQPDHLDAAGLADLEGAGVQLFAYLSLGEAAPGSIDPGWVLGRNDGWGSVVVDLTAAGWRDRVLLRVDALRQSGYRGLFLDTLDSYLRVLRGAQAHRAARALAGLVRDIHERHPDLKLFLNRGFEILDEVGWAASGLAAESLLFGWDPSAKRYVPVREADREWLRARLEEVRDRFGIPVVVVDYLPPARRDEARRAAERIAAMGFVPWISTPALDVVGVARPPAPATGDGTR
jgi:hypothetical protein